VEEALLGHPAVAECAVIGHPDPGRGSIVKAFVVVDPAWPEREGLAALLQDHVKAAIAPYKYPRAIAFVDALPRTATGKLQRFVLRQAADQAGTSSFSGTAGSASLSSSGETRPSTSLRPPT
jgi:2-aminobenzoate-CoA ligase